jgi:hypothetical protein
MSVTVTGLSTTAVKGMRVSAVDVIDLDANGARGNRAFYVIDALGRMVNGKQLGGLQAIVPAYDLDGGTLTLTFADGSVVDGAVEYGDTITTRFFSRECAARELDGPWSAAVSDFLGRPLRLVEPALGVDRGPQGTTSIISRASLRRLAEAAESDDVDGRRFRMLIEVDGVAAHEEDAWIGRDVRAGDARLRMHGNIGRCLVTSRDPETGEVTLPTLDLLGGYRREIESTEPLPFGIYGEVVEGGAVRVGDIVEPLDG